MPAHRSHTDRKLPRTADRNTTPAIALAILHMSQGENGDPEGRMLVLAADHVMTNQSAFYQAEAKATRAARVSYLMTFGIQQEGPGDV